jgi:hypothetical protein
MHNTNELIHEVLGIDVQQLETAEACSEQLRIAGSEANKMAAYAVGYGQHAIRFAIKSGEIINKAKAILPHGEFGEWLNAEMLHLDIAERTAQKWMKLAKAHIGADLMDNPDVKTITDAYRATGILPEPEAKQDNGEGDKEKPPFTLTFKTKYHDVSEWDKDVARDFLYEFERIAQLAVKLKTEFGL